MNKIMLIGRITKEVDMRYTQSANPTAISKTGLAVKREFKREGEPEADFFNLTLFGKQAENFQKYAAKGRLIAITGRMQFHTWEKDGVKRTGHDIMVDQFELLESKKEAATNNQDKGSAGAGEPFTYDFTSEDDDLPF